VVSPPQIVLVLVALFLGSSQSDTELSAKAEALHEEGLRLFQQGKIDAARDAMQESLRIHEKLGRKEEQAINLRALALIHDGIGERQRSFEFYDRALKIGRSIGSQQIEANTLRDLGILHYNLDNNDRAFEYLSQALVLQRKLSKPAPLAGTLFGLAEMRRYRGDLKVARPLYDEALQLARTAGERKVEADTLSSLALLDIRNSRSLIDEALQIRTEMKDVQGEASTRLKLGTHLHANGDQAGALEQYRKSADMFASIRYRGGEAIARQYIAVSERNNGRLAEASAAMLKAVELAETLRQRLSDRDLRATYIGYVQNRYEFLIETYLEQGDRKRAFEISERARARALVETLSDVGVRGDAQPTLTLEEIQQTVLDSETVLFEYALGNTKSHLFIVRRNGLEYRPLPGRSALESMARKAYEAYRNPEQPAASREVLAKTLQLNAVGTAKRVLVVADGALQYLPFADLTSANVVIAPSASTVAAIRSYKRTDPANKKRVAVFADPVAPQFARLPFARMEAESILQSVPALMERVTVLGADATRAAVLKTPASILHFAAHGILDTANPERTQLVLSSGSLGLRDIYGMRVDADLVVLSACQTALGKEMKREGLIGLTRAFQQAGADRVVASLWKVDDRATAELMKHFYAGMFAAGQPASLALQEAQRKLAASKRWSHPFYWAAFVLQGEWR
jgi:tetratricopeptide (TPR) repeat protein